MKHVSKRSGCFLSVCLLAFFLFGVTGCAKEKPLVFDYASQPEEFVVKLKPNQPYTIAKKRNIKLFGIDLILKRNENAAAHLADIERPHFKFAVARLNARYIQKR